MFKVEKVLRICLLFQPTHIYNLVSLQHNMCYARLKITIRVFD